MANLVVFSELHENHQPTEPTRLALAHARAISNALGATVYAAVASGPMPTETLDELAAVLGRAGADRVVVWSHPTALPFPVYATHGPFLEAVGARLRPRLFMFPSGLAALQLAPVFAARACADYFSGATPLVLHARLADGEVGALVLSRRRASQLAVDELDVMDADRMVVCTLAPGTDTLARGEDRAEIEVMSLPPPCPPVVVAAVPRATS